MSSLPLYAVDIETDTTPCHDPAQECCTTRGLDPFRTTITEIVIKGDGISLVLDDADGEIALLERFRHLMRGLPAGVVVGWNSHVFDMPATACRAKENGLPRLIELAYDPSIPVKYAPLPGHLGGYRAQVGPHRHIDICHYFKPIAESLGVRHSLKPVAEAILGFTPVSVDRANMHLLSAEERNEYVTSDGLITVELARRIPADEFEQLIDPLLADMPIRLWEPALV